MFGSQILEVAIGLVFVFLLMSIFCSAVTEWIARWLALRARTLSDGILNLINDDKGLFKNVLNNPFFLGLSSKTRGKHWWDGIKIGKWEVFTKNEYGPSEIPPATFSQIIIDALIEGGDDNQAGYQKINTEIERRVEAEKEAKQSKKVKQGDDEEDKDTQLQKTNQVIIENITQKLTSEKALDLHYKKRKDEFRGDKTSDETAALSTTNQQLLNSFLFAAKTKAKNLEDVMTEFRKSLETWFDDSMQRVTGWYKRKTQVIILCLALPICFCLNVDTLAIASSLYTDPSLREAVVANAEAYVANAASENATAASTNATLETTYNKVHDELTGLNLPIGWTTDTTDPRHPATFWGWLLKIGGILITAFAVSMGAPFWFDLLNKLVNLRAAGNKPKKPEEPI
jgi:hypothetical protein